jgi:hypothetical protein
MYDQYFQHLAREDEAGARWVVIRYQLLLVPSFVRVLLSQLLARVKEIVR